MKLESERLHQPPEPWYSEHKYLFKGAIVFNVLVWIITIFIYWYDAVILDSQFSAINVFTAFMIVIGALLMYYAYHMSTDHEATWCVQLPYNKLLFELLVQKIPEILQDGGFDYDANILINFHGVEINKETKEKLARSYTIGSNFGDELLLEFGLKVEVRDGNRYHSFIMEMDHIQMNNLSVAKNFAHDVKKYLKEIEFDKFERVTKEPKS